MEYPQPSSLQATPDNGRPSETVADNSEAFGNLPNASEPFRTVPQGSETFRTVPKDSECFRNVRQNSEPKEYCTLTVREAARLFEGAGVARTERSIINWCQPNKMGVARLDNYFDPNERKYFISSQSVELAIQEERAKAAKGSEPSEAPEPLPNASERPKTEVPRESKADIDRVKELEQEVMDLRIMNKGKDYFIEQLKNEREGFETERDKYIEQLIASNRKVGELETHLLQLRGPDNSLR